MPDTFITIAPWIALASCIAMLFVVGVGARRTWGAWRRTRVTQEAATALFDVHMADLDAALQRLDERTGTIADDGEQLAETLAELRADVAHLRWMVAQIPEERERLARELFELVLPTRPRGERAEAGADDA